MRQVVHIVSFVSLEADYSWVQSICWLPGWNIAWHSGNTPHSLLPALKITFTIAIRFKKTFLQFFNMMAYRDNIISVEPILNRILRRIFGPKSDENGEWRRLHNEELLSLYRSPNRVRVIKSRRLRWAGHVARMGDLWEGLGVDGRTILEWTLKG